MSAETGGPVLTPTGELIERLVNDLRAGAILHYDGPNKFSTTSLGVEVSAAVADRLEATAGSGARVTDEMVEAAARATDPDLFSDDERLARRTASPWKVDFARGKARELIRKALEAAIRSALEAGDDRARIAELEAALKEAERFMEYFSGETGNMFVGAGTPKECLALIRSVLDGQPGAKPLEWEIYAGDRQVGEQREYYGFHEFGYYVASKTDDAWSVGTFTNRGKKRVVGFYGTLADAKSAAQYDFDRAVRSALSAKEQGK